jgi:hypothetical protein
MPKCYLMINDTDDGIEYALNLDLPQGEDPPKTVDDMSPAQEAVWNFYNVLQGMFDPEKKAAMEREVQSKILIPEGSITH